MILTRDGIVRLAKGGGVRIHSRSSLLIILHTIQASACCDKHRSDDNTTAWLTMACQAVKKD